MPSSPSTDATPHFSGRHKFSRTLPRLEAAATMKTKDGSKIRQDIPQTGWTLAECIDHITADHRCAACGYPNVRFVHKVSHPSSGLTLLVGFVCSGELTGQPDTARLREYELRRIARRRARFLRSGWSSAVKDDGLRFAWREEGASTFWLKEQPDGTWSLHQSGRGVPEKLVSKPHVSRDAAAAALFQKLLDQTEGRKC